jgi:hypothetical protein
MIAMVIARTTTILALCAACRVVHRPPAEPYIETVRPDSVMLAAGAVVEVVVRGRGFAPGTPGRNTIQFGDATITNVPASHDGKEIHVVIPDRVALRGEAAPLPLEAGRYDLRVRTSAGTSNAVTMRVDR